MFLPRFTVFVLIICISRSSSEPSKRECRQLLRRVDKVVNKLFIVTNDEEKYFETKQEFITDYCEAAPAWIKTAAEYKACMQSFQRTLWGLVLKGMKDAQKKFCGTPADIELTFNHVLCFKKSNHDLWMTINDRLVGLCDYVANQSEDLKAIPSVCCGGRLILAEILRIGNSECKQFTGRQDTGDFLMGVVETMLDAFLDLVCAKHSSVEKCYEIDREMTTKLADMQMNQNTTDHRIMRSLIGVLQRLDTEMNIDG